MPDLTSSRYAVGWILIKRTPAPRSERGASTARGGVPLPVCHQAPPHHMLFKGADGVPYEVRGEVGSVFNILSSPRLSINSLFVQVPPRFPVCVPAE